MFRQEHLRLPDNAGEKRESLVILEKVGMKEGLLKSLVTEADVRFLVLRCSHLLDWHHWRRKGYHSQINIVLLNYKVNWCYSYGKNDKKLPKIKTYWQVLKEQFEDSTIQILLVAATFTLIIGLFDTEDEYKWLEGTSIYFAVAIITLFSSATNNMKEKQFLKLHD